MSSYLKPIETLGSKEICFKVALRTLSTTFLVFK
jgi:hypothetical protein